MDSTGVPILSSWPRHARARVAGRHFRRDWRSPKRPEGDIYLGVGEGVARAMRIAVRRPTASVMLASVGTRVV